jgi:hypothetical protein
MGLRNYLAWIAVAFEVLLIGFVIFIFVDFQKFDLFGGQWWPERPRRTSFLVINSPYDEALRLLKGTNLLYWKAVKHIKQRRPKNYGGTLIRNASIFKRAFELHFYRYVVTILAAIFALIL